MCSVDLKDAYLSVPIAKQHRKFLRFVWEEITYKFTCLLFGLCSALRIFTKFLCPVVAHLRFQGLRTVIYLDDMLIMDEDKETLQLQVHQALTLLGFVINIPKSLLTPSCQITYLGLLVDSVSMKLCLTEEKLQQTTHSCRAGDKAVSHSTRPNFCHWQADTNQTGSLTSTSIHTKPSATIDRDSPKHRFIQSQNDFEPGIPGRSPVVDPPAPTLEWESNHDTTTRHDHSDASLQGWGAVYNGTQTGDCGRFWRVNAT